MQGALTSTVDPQIASYQRVGDASVNLASACIAAALDWPSTFCCCWSHPTRFLVVQLLCIGAQHLKPLASSTVCASTSQVWALFSTDHPNQLLPEDLIHSYQPSVSLKDRQVRFHTTFRLTVSESLATFVFPHFCHSTMKPFICINFVSVVSKPTFFVSTRPNSIP